MRKYFVFVLHNKYSPKVDMDAQGYLKDGVWFFDNHLYDYTLSYLAYLSGVSDVMIASVDCNAADNVNKELCINFSVNGVPNIQIIKDGVKVGDFTGKRDLESLMNMVEINLHPEKFKISEIEEQNIAD